MAPTPSKSNLSTLSTKPGTSHHQSRTPQSKHRLIFTKETTANAAAPPSEHPVEVVGRIRDHPELKKGANSNPTALQISGDGKSVRLKTEIGYRDFSLDGVSMSEEDDLEGFYRKFVESRINGVKMGQKCTIMMYGPTGSGKSHTMFGCLKQPGVVYNSLKGILGEEDEERMGVGTFVQVTVLEIYNEEIYDLLSSGNNGGGFLGWPKSGSVSKVKLEVMGKKAKNATFISGNEAGKILKEIQKVEKRRIVKSTLCNERSSRSHCLIIIDVPTVGGRLMLVDMAGSENIEQAGQNGVEAKMQTGKINQVNIALKRVVESIANGDSHVPFRDSKLTMLLQDSFEDVKSKILMILCASPDPKELHKTIATLEYGAKAKCIVRGPHTPNKDKGAEDSSSAVILGSRIAAMDQFIYKLQHENKVREKERNEAQKELTKKEEEVSMLREKLAVVERMGGKPSEINSKVNERTEMLKRELERKIRECQNMANEQVEMERRRMEEQIFQQQQEVEMLRQRLEDIEEIYSKVNERTEMLKRELERKIRECQNMANEQVEMERRRMEEQIFQQQQEVEMLRQRLEDIEEINSKVNERTEMLKRELERKIRECQKMANEQVEMERRRMEEQIFQQQQEVEMLRQRLEDIESELRLSKGGGNASVEMEGGNFMKRLLEASACSEESDMVMSMDLDRSYDMETNVKTAPISGFSYMNSLTEGVFGVPSKACLTTVYEEEEYDNEEEDKDNLFDDEVEKEVIEEKKMIVTPEVGTQNGEKFEFFKDSSEFEGSRLLNEHENTEDATSSRQLRIQNICTLCGNHRELSKTGTEYSASRITDDTPKLHDIICKDDKVDMSENLGENELGKLRRSDENLKEDQNPLGESSDDIDVYYMKWEASKESPKFINTFKDLKDSTLADLRKLLEIHLGGDQQDFTFLGDPAGAPVPREKEAATQISKLPNCKNQLRGHLACLSPVKAVQWPNRQPFSPLTPATPISQLTKKVDYCFSPEIGPHLSSSPFSYLSCLPFSHLSCSRTKKVDDCFSPEIGPHLSSSPFSHLSSSPFSL